MFRAEDFPPESISLFSCFQTIEPVDSPRGLFLQMLSLGHHSSSPRRTLPCLIVKLPKETCGTAGHRRVVRHDLLFGKVPVPTNIEIYWRLGSSVASKRASHAAVIQALSWIAPCSRGSRHPHARGASNWQRRRELP